MKSRRTLAQLDFVAPDIFDSDGGIGRIARAMTLALAHWADRHNVRLVVHALMDQGGRRKIAYLPVPHTYRSYDGARPRLVRELMTNAWRDLSRPHLVIFAHPNLAVSGLLLPPWVKIAVVAHGIDVWARLRFERMLALRRADVIWPVSHDTARHLTQTQGVPASQIKVLHNALDPCWPLPMRPRRGERNLLAVSRLHPEHTYKGIDLTIEALSGLAPGERPHFVVAGDGPDRPRLEALATKYGIEVTFTGRVSDARLAELYADALAFVLPSTGEGFGLVYLEAMAFALPCIAADAGGATEVVEHEVTGLLVPPRDVPALTAALRRVLTSEGRTMGLAGRARVEREFLFSSYEARVHSALQALTA